MYSVVTGCKIFKTRDIPDTECVGTSALAGPKQVAALLSILHQQALSNVPVGVWMKPAEQHITRGT